VTHYVRIDTPFRMWFDDLVWLLDRCDSVLPDRVCVCLDTDQLVALTEALEGRDLEYTLMIEKPKRQPLPKFVRLLLRSWAKDQREQWRCHSGYR